MTDHGCKVCRVLDERGLDRLDDELVARWRGESGERMGYRRLADWLNAALLRREMEHVGLPTGGGEARSRYDRLTDDDTADAVAALLRRAGVAVDDLRDDFLSYSVVRTHLRDCLGAERDPEPPSDWEADRLDDLAEYTTAQAAEAVRSLVNKESLAAGGEVEPTVTIRVRCSAWGTAVPVEEALAAGAFCACAECECGAK
jgi:hypothetical protein